jgi:hypothetical protein
MDPETSPITEKNTLHSPKQVGVSHHARAKLLQSELAASDGVDSDIAAGTLSVLSGLQLE